MCMVCCVFFFKQKTAYEMRISDWSSDVCSSDLWLQTVGESILRRLYQRCEEIYAPSESMAAVLHDQRMSRHIAIWSRGIDRQLFHPGRRDPEWRRSLGIAEDRKRTRLNSSH